MFGRIDWDDRIFAVAFLLASAISVGFVTVPNTSFFSETIYTLGSGTDAAEFSVAKLVSLVALLAAIASNRTDFSRLTGVEFWVAIATIGLVIGPPFMPLLDSLISQSFVAGAFALTIQAGGFFIISYLG